MQNPGEKNNSSESIYRQKLDEILSTELTTENINTYADDAINQLVELIDEVKDNPLLEWNLDPSLSPKDREDAMLREVLGGIDVGEVLDYIESVGNDIHDLDAIIAKGRANQEQTVYVPTDRLGYAAIVAGSGDFAEKELLPKAKTALFILQNDFGVDLNNPEEFRMSTGIITDDMMRKTSYDVIEAPALERAIFSCDELGNRTFVFNTTKLDERNITIDQLKNFTKQQLLELLEKNPELGVSFTYGKKYPERLSAFIDSPENKQETEALKEAEQRRQYLKKVESVPDGYITMNGYAKAHKIDYSTIRHMIEKNSDLKPKQFKGDHGQLFDHYKVEDLDRLFSEFLRIPPAPDDYITITGYAKAHNRSKTTIMHILRESSNLKPERFKDKSGRISDHYRVEDLDRLFPEPIPATPDGYITMSSYAKMRNIPKTTVQRRIGKSSNLKSEQFKDDRGQMRDCYKVEDLDRLFSESLPAPEGYTTIYNYAKVRKIGYLTIQQMIEGKSDLKPERFNDHFSRMRDHYKVEDLDKLFPDSPPTPEGYVTMAGYARIRNISETTIRNMLKENGNLKPEQFKYRGQMRNHYKVEDLDKTFAEFLKVPPVPEGYTTMFHYAAAHQKDPKTLRRYILEKSDLRPEQFRDNQGVRHDYYKIEDLDRLVAESEKK